MTAPTVPRTSWWWARDPPALALAAQLAACNTRPRIIDRAHDRVHESRALAIQPRTLEVVAHLGVTDELISHGNPAVRLCVHAGRRVVPVPLFDLGLADTAYPYLLFLSQAEPNASSVTTSLPRGSVWSGASNWLTYAPRATW